jgi:pyruvate-formate lyase-activating enzyme
MNSVVRMRNSEWYKNAVSLNNEFGGKILHHCFALNGGQFAVTPGSLKACACATHEKGTPTICEYLQPNIDPQKFLSGLGNIIRENQVSDGPCVGCRYLVSTKMPADFVASFFSTISLHDFSGCNSHCIYCSGSEYHLPKNFIATFDHEILFNNLLQSRLIKPGVTTIAWGGGEPTLVNTYEKTVDFLRVNRIWQVINTSGIHYSDATERVLRDKLGTVRISVDSGSNEIYSKVKRNPNFEKVWISVRKYASTGGDFVLKYILLPLNSEIDEINKFLIRSQDAGVKKICISVDSRYVYNNEIITLKELTSASAMYNSAKSTGIEPYFEVIWLPEQIKQIEKIGNFQVEPSHVYNTFRNIYKRIINIPFISTVLSIGWISKFLQKIKHK